MKNIYCKIYLIKISRNVINYFRKSGFKIFIIRSLTLGIYMQDTSFLDLEKNRLFEKFGQIT